MEVEATVADYFHMLTMELAGRQYSKTNISTSVLLGNNVTALIE